MQIELPSRGWAPRWYQKAAWDAILNPDIRNIVLAWARRHGKDELALQGTVIRAMQRVGTYYHCLPEYSQARKVIWDMVNPRTGQQRWRDIFPSELISKVDNQSMMLTLVNGSTWQLIGSDNTDSLMGGAPVGIVFSEAALANPTTVAFFEPMLLENKGWCMHISSVRGKNHFYNEFLVAQEDPHSFASHISAFDTDVFTREDLDKTRKTYIKRHGQALGEAIFNQEFASSWDAAVVGSVFGREIADLEAEGRARPIAYDPRYPVHTSWDIGVGDSTVILYWQIVNDIPRLIDWYKVDGRGLQTCVEELQSKRYMYGMHLAPHDIAVRSWASDGLSRIEEAKRLGLNFRPTVRPETKHLGISASASLIRRMEVNVRETPVDDPTEDCRFILDTLKQYRFSYDKERNIMSKNPIHDWTSHYADALQTMAIWDATEGTARGSDGYTVQGLADKQFSGKRLKDFLSRQNAKPLRGAWG